jgi:membrane-bound lytic murein transglycosylase D
MSAVDLRESSARVDRSGSRGGSEMDPQLRTARRRWTAGLLVVPLLLVLPTWLQEDPAQVASVLRAQGVNLDLDEPAMPLHMNESVAYWIEAFQTTRRDEFDALLRRRGVFEGMIRDKLRERGMPQDLLYLAVIESGLSPVAESHVSAVGLWQFMGPTALDLGLRVDEYVDERRDPLRATDAALDYLEYLYGRFGSWYLAAAAYNAGPGRVERILNRHADGRTGDEDIYWEVLRYLPRETREYVPRLVATTILANDAESLGLAGEDSEAYEFELVFVPGRTSLTTVARSLVVDVGIVHDLNPHLVRGITPPGEIYGVRVPLGGSHMVMAYMAEGPSFSRAD